MIHRLFVAALVALLPSLAQAQLSPGTAVAAPGATTARTLASRASDMLNVMDFGAKGDCATDDTAAFNAYAAYLRNLSGYQGYARVQPAGARLLRAGRLGEPHGAERPSLQRQLGKLGGAARARKLTPEQRAEIARKGAAMRWTKS